MSHPLHPFLALSCQVYSNLRNPDLWNSSGSHGEFEDIPRMITVLSLQMQSVVEFE